MNIMMEFTYPASKAEEAGKVFMDVLQANPLPDYVKIVEIYQYWGGDGLKGHAYYNLEKGKEEEGVRHITITTREFSKAIEGYKAVSEVVYSLAEAFDSIGMKAPAA
jgi:hypothetical protein